MPRYTEGSHKSQDALSEVMILVKEEAKTHDLKLLIAVSKCALAQVFYTEYPFNTDPSRFVHGSGTKLPLFGPRISQLPSFIQILIHIFPNSHG